MYGFYLGLLTVHLLLLWWQGHSGEGAWALVPMKQITHCPAGQVPTIPPAWEKPPVHVEHSLTNEDQLRVLQNVQNLCME